MSNVSIHSPAGTDPGVPGQGPANMKRVQVVPPKHVGRWFTGLVTAALMALLIWGVATAPNIAWDVVGEYFFNGTLMEGMRLTIVLALVALVVGVVLGTIVATMRLSSNPVLQAIASGYIAVFRGTPLLIQIIFWYNIALVVPKLTLGWPAEGLGVSVPMNTLMTPTVAAILALGLNEAAYMAEIVRGGVLSIPKGQEEAASSLGLNPKQTMWRVVLPQAVRSIIPPTGNQLIVLLKNTSLVSVIAARELLTASQQIYAQNFYTIELLIVAAFWYLAMTTVATVGQSYLERRFEYTQRSRATPFLQKLWQTATTIGRPKYMEIKA
ncbi:amino acid ABC transporter permease [Arthrobacter sp. UYEF36]|uniref:amino acid ABC transporter permease n=1 Tax=Arthrobacter sp. UYEF36 TaxID=1756366 RepID=UPI00339AB281